MIGDKIVLNKTGTHFYLDGKEVKEAVYRQRHPLPKSDSGVPGGTQTAGWPIVSDALAVHPKRRQEAIDDAVAKGVPTEFTPSGQPILRDRAHRREYCRAYGFHDNNGGYGDP